MKIQINVEIPNGDNEFKEYEFERLCSKFGAKHLSKFIKPWDPIYSPTHGNHGRRYYGAFHILTNEQIKDIRSLCYYNAPNILKQLELILDRPIEELNEVNDH